jgi:hypothetical protein
VASEIRAFGESHISQIHGIEAEDPPEHTEKAFDKFVLFCHR